jgi:hypothetical protein
LPEFRDITERLEEGVDTGLVEIFQELFDSRIIFGALQQFDGKWCLWNR